MCCKICQKNGARELRDEERELSSLEKLERADDAEREEAERALEARTLDSDELEPELVLVPVPSSV